MSKKPKTSPRNNRSEAKEFVIKIDTREQRPWTFPKEIQTVIGKLDEGDYAVAGLEDRFIVERKSLQDAWQTLTHGRERFRGEILRAISKDAKMLILVEGSPSSFLAPGLQGNQTNPESLRATVKIWRKKYGIEFLFVKGRVNAAKYAARWLYKRWEEWHAGLWEEYEPPPFTQTPWPCFLKKKTCKSGGDK